MVPLGLIRFRFPGLPGAGLPGVSCAFTTRRGGESSGPYHGGNLSFDVGDAPAAVAANRRALARALSLSAFCELKQVHGDALRLDPAPADLMAFCSGPAATEGDALATATPGAALCIKTADCQPILIAHREGRFVAALHAGWRGNVLGLPQSAIARLCDHYAARPADLLAVRGPSLGPQAAQFTNFEAEFGPAFRPFYHPDTQTVDLWSLTRHQLQSAGLPASQIFGLDLCTLSNPDDFFSYRATSAGRATGRQMSLIWLG